MHMLRISNLKKIIIIIIIILGCMILYLTVKFLQPVDESIKKLKVEKWDENIERKADERNFLKIFHLDLKGGAPKLSYLLKILPVIHEAGANAILIEYEDMFPFSGKLENVAAGNAYTLGEIKILVEFAESLLMEVIPLVQTFGHLEYVLKLEEFERLRESKAFPQEICPLNKEAVDLVKEMIRQVMAVHPKSKYFHIGCDEVRHIGTCSRCSRVNSKTLFSNHVKKIANFIKSHYPKVTPLIWDDMLRRWTLQDLEKSELGSAVEPVVWVYGKNIFTIVPSFVWNNYNRIFPAIWVASAFKGAFGEKETVPNLKLHLDNLLSWMKILTGESKQFPPKSTITGIFLTGWSRYDHFAVLCELLPVGIPSLLLSLTFLNPKFNTNLTASFNKWLTTLQCPRKYLLSSEVEQTNDDDGILHLELENCSFPGSDLYMGVIQHKKLKNRVVEMKNLIESGGWTSEYNLIKNFTSPWRLSQMFQNEGFAGEFLLEEISTWKSVFLVLMKKYFDQYTSTEWEEQNIKPLEDTLAEIHKNFRSLMGRKNWPRRPLS